MTVVISGASRGIGKELINFFLQKKGVKIIALSSHPEKLRTFEKKKNFHAVKADFTIEDSIYEVTETIRTITGEISILINNAGVLVNKPFSKITSKELELCYRVNVFAPFLLSQQLLPLMGKKEKSHIVNISSMGGFQGSSKFAGLSAYSSSKGALSILSECLAEEFKDKNISVNCLCPGAVNTEMLQKAFPGYKARTSAKEMAAYIGDFALNGNKFYNGKVLPVNNSNP
ncbi:MAG TPA: SDR family oxidoreductase [Bacteroidia bacterium]|jgi:3-oxoacyl-[acyl-carrier protein] reductase|nr:SDR family oxidoreductase [Bacteroidia bacterium]